MYINVKKRFYFKIFTIIVSFAAFYASYWVNNNIIISNSSEQFKENAAVISMVIFSVLFIGVIIAQLINFILDSGKFSKSKK